MNLKVIVACIMSLQLCVSYAQKKVFPGADEKTPSRAQYFSWINNTNEGATEEHTMINLDFFKWLQDEYGMILDIYAYDAGAIDGAKFYGSIYSDRFKKQFPNGFDPMYKKAKAMGTRLGVWGGPDGFGDTPEQEKARTEEMVKLCRDYEFALFKFDAVCGPLRPEKEDAFINMMEKCRSYSPDLILLNHRLGLKKSKDQATTFLWGGQETYIDIHISNSMTATHHRAEALNRGLPPGMKRLTEDHGVCISSCVDNWDDDLILQAFNRSLILAPEIYGNPWFLNDNEYAKLARIYNVHRKYRDILVNGMVLPESNYGKFAVSRGDKNTRFITLRNVSWNPVTYKVKLDKEIGYNGNRKVTLRQFHPTEKVIGKFKKGETVDVVVEPFRACLLMVSGKKDKNVSVSGCEYEVVREVKGKPVVINVFGEPGTTKDIKIASGRFKKAFIDGIANKSLAKGKSVKVNFEGEKLTKKLHRKLITLKKSDVPVDAESIYEATCFAGDNNALEVRSLVRSGETKIPQVKAARDAFFNQKAFVDKGCWDRYLFDGDKNTTFFLSKRKGADYTIKGGAFRLDLGEIIDVDDLVIEVPDVYSLLPVENEEGVVAEVSADLKNWRKITFLSSEKMKVPVNGKMRYMRLLQFPSRISEITGYKDGNKLDSKKWRASNLFAHPVKHRAFNAWKGDFVAKEVTNQSYLCVAINGKHGFEGAYAGMKIDGKYVGAPDRAPSYMSNIWEHDVDRITKNYTYYFPMTKDMEGKNVEVYVLGFESDKTDLNIEVWQTVKPATLMKKRLVLE